MSYAENDGQQLYYETHGRTESSAPTLVFAHGAGGNALSWWQQVPDFTDTHRVVVFDHRGFGRSTATPEQQDALHFDSDLIAILDHAEISSATIVCQSMGGWTGVRAAVNHSDRVDGVLLGNTPGAVRNDAVVANWETLTKRINEGGGLVNRAISEPFSQRNPRGALLYQQISALNEMARPNLQRDGIALTPDQVKASGVPFWVLASDLDPLFPPDLLASVAEDIDAYYVHIKGAGHSTYFEKPDAFNAVLAEFLRR